MSGFEIAGIVLGAFPIAICALEKYGEVATRFDRFRHIQLEYKKWYDGLKYQQLTFTQNLRQLILPLVVDDGKAEELLASPLGDAWRDAAISSQLENRLRQSYPLYIEYIEGTKRVMEVIHRELALDSTALQSQLNDPSKSYIASRGLLGIKEKLMFKRYALKFSNNEAVRQRLFNELQSYNDKLEKLLRCSDEDSRLMQKRATAGQVSALDNALCSFWRQAQTLFRALILAFKCHCQQHEAKLLLQHRTSKKTEFQVIFVESVSSRWELHRTRIWQGDDVMAGMVKENLTLFEATPTVISMRQPEHRLNRPTRSAFRSKNTRGPSASIQMVSLKPPPSVTLTTTLTGSHLGMTEEISNLCVSLRLPEASCCGYLAEDDCRYYVYSISRQTAETVPSITLDHILRGAVSPSPTRTQRFTLSLIMASSFLQLMDSPWLPASPLQKTDVHFLSDPTNPNIFLLDQPHISHDFVLARANAVSNITGSRPETPFCDISDALDHVGIMLLELCFGQILEDQLCRKRWPLGSNDRERTAFDVTAARQWLLEVHDEAGPAYAGAVGWCLGGNRDRPERWRQEMLVKVIQPLQRSLDFLANGGVV